MTRQLEHRGLGEAPFRLGDWLVEPRINRLTRGDESIQIELKMMDVLVCLAERAGELATRREIIDTVWATEFITEKTLTRAVAELRRTLGDDAKDPRYIETIHRKGYRLVASVEFVQQSAAKVTPFPSRLVEREYDRSPYPGLAAFTENDAEFFLGREPEVAQLWRKITTRRLLALIGPSGVGKSSLVRAGLIPASPEGWGSLVFHPGESAFRALGRALAPEFEGDSEAVAKLVDVSDEDAAFGLVVRWRQLHARALLIVDQFEELFTLNQPDTQVRFAALMGKLAREGDVHVLLSMRDDFHYRCHEHELLVPVFDSVSPISTPSRAGLRRALVEPAARFGFAFEDEGIVEEMLDAVEGERGALPLLAFTVARLWEERDRSQRRLSRQIYETLGGVHGALAGHAEATVDRIGHEHLPTVRELFRNLVTAEGTRAVREWDELLSVFGDSSDESQAAVLGSLIDARLLTSYEVREEGRQPTRRIEIIHESLLTNWPRLIGWRTQDADSARLRDQLRRAAKTWDEHGRGDDTLWSGAAYREFASWQDRYPGGLSEIEEGFARAMTAHATRRRRRRRVAATAVFAVLLGVLIVVGTFWRSSVLEARRAEAAKLLALAQLQLDVSPAEALAYATSSLNLADTGTARLFALEALAAGPPATVLEVGDPVDDGDYAHSLVFSRDGAWAAFQGYEAIRVVSRDGRVNRCLEPFPSQSDPSAVFDPDGRFLFACGGGELRTWSVPDFGLLDSQTLPTRRSYPIVTGSGLYVISYAADTDEIVVSAKGLDGTPTLVGRLDGHPPRAIDRQGRWLAFARGSEVLVRSLQDWESPPRMIANLEDPVVGLGFFGERIAAGLERGELWMFPVEDADEPIGPFPIRAGGRPYWDATGTTLGESTSQPPFSVNVWHLLSGRRVPLPRRVPVNLTTSGLGGFFNGAAFTPDGSWFATAHVGGVAFWPLTHEDSTILAEGVASGTALGFRAVEFTRDGRFLIAILAERMESSRQTAAGYTQSRIEVWDLEAGGPKRTLAVLPFLAVPQLAIDPLQRFVAVSTPGAIALVPLAGGAVRRLEGFERLTWIGDVAIDAEGRRVAACSFRGSADDKVIRVWDLETEEVTVLGPVEGAGDGFNGQITGLEFLPDGSLVSSGDGGLWLWILQQKTYEVLDPSSHWYLSVFGDGRYAASVVERADDETRSDLEITDLEMRVTRTVAAKVPNPGGVATDPRGEVLVSFDVTDGRALRVGATTASEPHLLLGHREKVYDVAVSPDGLWIASTAFDGTIRLWPMPDLSKPPLHTLPREELIAKLHSLTNLRAVRDEDSSTGWTVDVGPFPGWETVPTW